VTPELLAALRGPDGAVALAAATLVGDADPLYGAQTMRDDGIPADLAAAALTQVKLRARARAKFGPDADRMFLTREGLEQATRAVVADRRAARLAAAGVTTAADLGCGLGADAFAMARKGIRVSAVDLDPLTAAVAAANAAALGLADRVTVRHAAADSVDLSTVDAVFCDPARRKGGTRVFDPRAYSPPWDFVTGLAARVPRTVLKVAPGIDHALVAAGTEAEWVSVDGDVVEAALWYGPLAGVPRRATLLPSGATLTGPGTVQAPVGPVRRYVYDPDGAVVRAHLVAEFASTVDGTLADPAIAYVFTDRYAASPFGRGYEVTDVLPFSLKRLRALLRDRGVGRLTIKKRGSAIDPAALRRQLDPRGTGEATVILTRVRNAPTALVTRALD
jgi:SAM-dependent methyltransferase